MKYKVILEEDQDSGGYIVSCPSIPGCHSQGESEEEAIENIKEAIQACVDCLCEDNVEEAAKNPLAKVVDVDL